MIAGENIGPSPRLAVVRIPEKVNAQSGVNTSECGATSKDSQCSTSGPSVKWIPVCSGASSSGLPFLSAEDWEGAQTCVPSTLPSPPAYSRAIRSLPCL